MALHGLLSKGDSSGAEGRISQGYKGGAFAAETCPVGLFIDITFSFYPQYMATSPIQPASQL
jgi:hypothetical protein